MMTLRQLAIEPPTLPTRTTWYLTDLAEKTALVKEAIARQTGLFSLSDLHSACPGVSVDLIRTVLKRLKGKSVECLSRGHTAKWRKTAK